MALAIAGDTARTQTIADELERRFPEDTSVRFSYLLEDPMGALARLQLARAWTMAGDVGRARSAYEELLRLWKDADPAIPIVSAAHAEYAKLP